MYVTSIICIYCAYINMSVCLYLSAIIISAMIYLWLPQYTSAARDSFGTTSPGFNVGFLVIPHEQSGSCIMAIQHGAREICQQCLVPKHSQTHPNPIFVLPPPDGPTNNFWDVQQWWGCNFQWQYGCQPSLERLWTSNIVVVESLWKPYNKRSIVCRQAGWIRRNERTIEVRNQNQKIKIFSFYTKSL